MTLWPSQKSHTPHPLHPLSPQTHTLYPSYPFSIRVPWSTWALSKPCFQILGGARTSEHHDVMARLVPEVAKPLPRPQHTHYPAYRLSICVPWSTWALSKPYFQTLGAPKPEDTMTLCPGWYQKS